MRECYATTGSPLFSFQSSLILFLNIPATLHCQILTISFILFNGSYADQKLLAFLVISSKKEGEIGHTYQTAKRIKSANEITYGVANSFSLFLSRVRF